MEQWHRERRCVACGAIFTLAAHNNDAARYAAKHLEDGTLDPAVLPPVISKCPACLSGTAQHIPGDAPGHLVSSAKEQRAMAAAMAIGEQLERAQYDDVYYYTKRIGIAVGALSLAGIALVIGYRLLRDDFQPIPWILGIGFIGILGFGAAFWAFQGSRRG